MGNTIDVDEANNAHLEKKKNLIDLTLIFNKQEEEDEEDDDYEAIKEMNKENEPKHKAICKALRPPSDIK